MRHFESILPLVVAVLVAGVIISVIGGSHGHWIWFVLALGVVAELADGFGR